MNTPEHGDDTTPQTNMPFVTVASQGGPHDDQAYAAGWEMGSLATLLGIYRDHPHVHEQTIHAANQTQADLIAECHGYATDYTSTDTGGEWLYATFTRLIPEPA